MIVDHHTVTGSANRVIADEAFSSQPGTSAWEGFTTAALASV